MLDSLVRVSRRVGGATDLLATEMPAVQGVALAIRAGSPTRRHRSRQPGAGPEQVAPAQLHPDPWSSGSGSSREPGEKCCRRGAPPEQTVLADPTSPGARRASLNLPRQLRERLRLPLHSFTYS